MTDEEHIKLHLEMLEMIYSLSRAVRQVAGYVGLPLTQHDPHYPPHPDQIWPQAAESPKPSRPTLVVSNDQNQRDPAPGQTTPAP